MRASDVTRTAAPGTSLGGVAPTRLGVRSTSTSRRSEGLLACPSRALRAATGSSALAAAAHRPALARLPYNHDQGTSI